MVVEQRTENPCVPGSIPGGTTLKMKQLEFSDCFFFYIWIHLFTCAPEIIADLN